MKNNKRASRDVVNNPNNNNFQPYPRLAAQPVTAQAENAVAYTTPPQKPIDMVDLTTDDIEMEDPSADVLPAEESAPPTTTRPIVKSRKRTSLDEFAHRMRMRPEIKAGFKAWLGGQHFAFDNEWEQLFINYNNRKI